MELKERIALIIKENNLKQKELAIIMGVSDSYVSTLLSGRNANISTSVANLLEEKLSYHAHWILTGEEPKYKKLSNHPQISEIHRRVIFQLEKMTNEQAKAVLAFMDSLGKIESMFKENNDDKKNNNF